jgi:LuxR family maltose regulon positive regulatory protein
MFYWLEVPSITACRTLAAQASNVELKKGLAMLTRYASENQAVHNIRQLIDITALQALVNAKLGNHREASRFMQQALELAEPGGWIQPFIELGDPMITLLRNRQWQGATGELATRIIASFPNASSVSISASAPDAGLEMKALLTDRELEVLALLAQRYRNKEIAAQLYISPVTVKRHASNIYQKLQVSNRRQAVAKATELEIVSTT